MGVLGGLREEGRVVGDPGAVRGAHWQAACGGRETAAWKERGPGSGGARTCSRSPFLTCPACAIKDVDFLICEMGMIRPNSNTFEGLGSC